MFIRNGSCHRISCILLLSVVASTCLSTSTAFQTSAPGGCSLHSISRASSLGNKNTYHCSYNQNKKLPAIPARGTQLNIWNDDEGEISGPDKIKSCIPYMLPLLDGDGFGKYIYMRIPPLKFLDDLFIAPLVSILESFPFLGLILFVILSIGTRNVEGMSRSVRFNAQQAILIDVALIFPQLIGEGLGGFVPRAYEEIGNNFVYYAYMSAILYSCFSNLRGKKPDSIPYLSQAAEIMTGPF